MSINNIENIAFNYLTNLTTINADEVNTDILTKVDPDISDLQFDMLEGIHTNETIQQQIDNIETQIGNIGASYWFSAWDTTTQTNPVANTPRIVTWNNSDPSGNGIVAGPTTGSIKVLNTNAYNIQFSFQLHQTSSSNANVTIWLRKNGTDILASAGEYDVKGNDHLVIVWNYVMVLEANDYIQFVWASNSTSMTLAYQSAQTTPYSHPSIPSVIITVTNVTGEGPQGPAGPAGPQGPQGERGPRGYKGEPGDGSVDETARALAGTALALATTAQATAILAESTALGAVAANGTQDIAIGVLQVKTQKIQYDVDTDSTEISNNITMPNYDNPFTEPPAVVIKNDSQSVFRYGITSSDLISTTNRFISTSGQSYLNSLVINTDLEVGTTSNMLSSVFIGRDNNSQKKIILYDNNSGDDYDYTGIWVDNSAGANNFNCEIDGNPNSTFAWYAGNGFGSGRTLLKEITPTTEFSTVEEAIFLRQNANTQEIRLVRDVPNKIVQITFNGDTSGLGDYDGRIIQQAGNSLTDGTGLMIIEAGSINLTALVGDVNVSTNTKVNINAEDEINIAATSILGSINISTDTSDIALTSAAALNLSSNAGMNITSTRAANNAITFTTNTTDNDITLTNATTNNFKVNSIGPLNLTTGGILAINSGSNNTTLTTTALLDINTNNTTLTTTALLDINTNKTDIFSTDTTIINSNGEMTINSDSNLTIATTSVGFDFNINAAQNLNLTADGVMTLSNTLGKTRIETSSIVGPIEISSAAAFVVDAKDNIELQSTDGNINITSSAGSVITQADGNISLTSTSNDVNLTGTDIQIESTSGGINMISNNGGGMSATTGSLLFTSVAGSITTDAYGANIMDGGSIQITSASTNAMTSSSTTTITSSTGDVDIVATSGEISFNCDELNVKNGFMSFSFIPTGTINTSVVNTVPLGFLRCNGQAVSRSTYSRLFTAIGTTFGSGDGITTFNVPNFQGAFLRGWSNQTVGGVTYTAPAIGTAQQDQVLSATYATNEGFRDAAAGTRECVSRSRITSDPVDTNTGILAQFPRQGTENRPMNYAVYYNIKF